MLNMLARYIAAQHKIGDLTEALAAAMRRAMSETSVALHDMLDGEVAI